MFNLNTGCFKLGWNNLSLQAACPQAPRPRGCEERRAESQFERRPYPPYGRSVHATRLLQHTPSRPILTKQANQTPRSATAQV